MIPANGSTGCGATTIDPTRRATERRGSSRSQQLQAERGDVDADEGDRRRCPVDGSRRRRHGCVELRRRRLIGHGGSAGGRSGCPPPRRIGRPVTTLMTAGSSAGGKNGSVRLPTGPALARSPERGGRRPPEVVRPGRPSGASDTPPARDRTGRRRADRGRASVDDAVGRRRRRFDERPHRRVQPSGRSRSRRRCSPRARTARLTAGRCALARRRNAADVTPVGTLDVPRATRMLVVDVSSTRRQAAQAWRRGPAPRRRAAGPAGSEATWRCTRRPRTAADSRARAARSLASRIRPTCCHAAWT